MRMFAKGRGEKRKEGLEKKQQLFKRVYTFSVDLFSSVGKSERDPYWIVRPSN